MKAILRNRSGLDRGGRVALEEFPFVIGRDSQCHLRLASALVSRTHCQLDRVGQRLLVRDLESTNGTFVNDVGITGRQVLLPGDVLRIGMTVFNVDLEEDLGDETVSMDRYADGRTGVEFTSQAVARA